MIIPTYLSTKLQTIKLFLSTKYTGVDPETPLSGTTNAQGADYFNMPNTRSFTFNLRANF